MPSSAQGNAVWRADQMPPFTEAAASSQQPHTDIAFDETSLIESVDTGIDDLHKDKSPANLSPLPTPSGSISSKRKYSEVVGTAPAAKEGEQKLPRISASMVSRASDSSGSRAKSSRSASSDTSNAISQLAQAFALSFKPEVVNPTGHARTEAGKALKEDDNGLTNIEKAKLLGIFAKDPAMAEMYLVTRDDEALRKEFIATLL